MLNNSGDSRELIVQAVFAVVGHGALHEHVVDEAFAELEVVGKVLGEKGLPGGAKGVFAAKEEGVAHVDSYRSVGRGEGGFPF